MSEAMKVAQQIVELCKQNKALDAIQSLYSPDIVSIEAMGGPEMPRRIQGLDAVRKKAEWWEANHEVHGAEFNGPWPHDDRFILHMRYHVTPKVGPMAGQRITLDEAGLYTVKDGKVVQEEFFYHMG